MSITPPTNTHNDESGHWSDMDEEGTIASPDFSYLFPANLYRSSLPNTMPAESNSDVEEITDSYVEEITEAVNEQLTNKRIPGQKRSRFLLIAATIFLLGSIILMTSSAPLAIGGKILIAAASATGIALLISEYQAYRARQRLTPV